LDYLFCKANIWFFDVLNKIYFYLSIEFMEVKIRV